MRPFVKFRTNERTLGLTNQQGFSLVEELVALSVVSLGLVLLVAMIGTGTKGVTSTIDKVTAEDLARSQLELVKGSTYHANPTSAPYPTAAAPTPYAVGMTIQYWTAPSGPFTSSVRNDGMQKITVTVTRNGTQILQLEDYKVNR